MLQHGYRGRFPALWTVYQNVNWRYIQIGGTRQLAGAALREDIASAQAHAQALQVF
jgi:hypothetical protein